MGAPHQAATGIDPADLAEALRVIALAHDLPPEHPDAVTIRQLLAGRP